MEYESIILLATYFQWLVGIVGGAVLFRILVIIKEGTLTLEEVNLGMVFTKVKNHVKAVVICTLFEFIAEFIKKFYF